MQETTAETGTETLQCPETSSQVTAAADPERSSLGMNWTR